MKSSLPVPASPRPRVSASPCPRVPASPRPRVPASPRLSAGLAATGAAITLFAIACNKPRTVTTNQTPASVPSASSPRATPDEFASARITFEKRCAVCHGEKAEGGIVKVEDVKLKVPSLKTGHALKHTDEQFIKQITNGGDGMPKFQDKLKPEEIRELARFIRHEFQGDRPPGTPSDMKMKGMKMN
jgi:mono/diheme cytochrome c family protein